MQGPDLKAPQPAATCDDARGRDDVREEIRKRRSNINPGSLLATDYLNHFNEIVMLFDLAADRPDCFRDAAAWQPVSYPDHFSRSNFSDRGLAINAYDYCPQDIRTAFDTTVAELDALLLDGIERCLEIMERGAPEEFRHTCRTIAADSRTLIDRLSAIIHGVHAFVPLRDRLTSATLEEAQETIDSLFEPSAKP